MWPQAALVSVCQVTKDVYLMMWLSGPMQRPCRSAPPIPVSACPHAPRHTMSVPAASCPCFRRCGDEIVEINESPVHCMSLNDVYAVLSHCSPGPVPIMVSRHPDPQVMPLGVPCLPQALSVSAELGRRNGWVSTSVS